MDNNDNGSKDKRGASMGLRVGILGVSLSLAGGGCAHSTSAEAATPPSSGNVRVMDLHESEVFELDPERIPRLRSRRSPSGERRAGCVVGAGAAAAEDAGDAGAAVGVAAAGAAAADRYIQPWKVEERGGSPG